MQGTSAFVWFFSSPVENAVSLRPLMSDAPSSVFTPSRAQGPWQTADTIRPARERLLHLHLGGGGPVRQRAWAAGQGQGCVAGAPHRDVACRRIG